MRLTQEQQVKVSENMALVTKVIQDKVHGVNQLGVYSYADIFQIGCIGLCKAAATDKGGCFSTYAYRVIWNEICTALIYASRRTGTEQLMDPDVMDIYARSDDTAAFEFEDIDTILERAAKKAGGITAKGIRALQLIAGGYTPKEIGAMMGVQANHVRVWVSNARKYLKTLPEFADIYPF